MELLDRPRVLDDSVHDCIRAALLDRPANERDGEEIEGVWPAEAKGALPLAVAGEIEAWGPPMMRTRAPSGNPVQSVRRWDALSRRRLHTSSKECPLGSEKRDGCRGNPCSPEGRGSAGGREEEAQEDRWAPAPTATTGCHASNYSPTSSPAAEPPRTFGRWVVPRAAPAPAAEAAKPAVSVSKLVANRWRSKVRPRAETGRSVSGNRW